MKPVAEPRFANVSVYFEIDQNVQRFQQIVSSERQKCLKNNIKNSNQCLDLQPIVMFRRRYPYTKKF